MLRYQVRVLTKNGKEFLNGDFASRRRSSEAQVIMSTLQDDEFLDEDDDEMSNPDVLRAAEYSIRTHGFVSTPIYKREVTRKTVEDVVELMSSFRTNAADLLSNTAKVTMATLHRQYVRDLERVSNYLLETAIELELKESHET